MLLNNSKDGNSILVSELIFAGCHGLAATWLNALCEILRLNPLLAVVPTTTAIVTCSLSYGLYIVTAVPHNIFHHRSAPYLNDFITFCTNNFQRCQLQSSTTRSAIVCRTRTQFSRRTFSFCDSDVCNSLPPSLRLID